MEIQTRLRSLDERIVERAKYARARENRLTPEKDARKATCGGKREVRKRKVLACVKDCLDLFSVIIGK